VRLADVAVEAWRDVLTGAARTPLLVASVGLVVAGLAVLDVTTVLALQSRAQQFREAGASTLVLDAPGQVDGRRCEALAEVDGVTSAGALRRADDPVVPLAAPRGAVPRYDATPGLLRLVGAPDAGGVALERTAADILGTQAGALLGTTAGPLPVSGTYDHPDDGRAPTLETAALVTSPLEQVYDQCWIEVWPADEARGGLLRTAVVGAGAPGDVAVDQLNTTLGAELDAAADFAARPSRWAPGVAGAAGLLLVLTSVRLRRLELAFARHVGVRRSEQAAQLVLEALVWLVPVAAVTTAAVAVVVSGRSPDWTQAVDAGGFGFRVLAAGVWGCLLGAAAGPLAVPERRLFAYFKDR
jgi:hypothetical protein